jgi:hypothetical protein
MWQKNSPSDHRNTKTYPYLSRAGLLAKMDTKAARRGFTSWDEDDDDVERVVPLVLGARPGTGDYWREFKNLLNPRNTLMRRLASAQVVVSLQ